MVENSKGLKERYPLISKKHPRTDLQPIYEVEIYIEQESRKNREVTAREISLNKKSLPKRVIDNALNWLYQLEKRVKRNMIGSRFFFTEEKSDGGFGNRFYTRKQIDFIKEEKSKEVIGFIKKNPSLLKKEILNHYQKLVNSLKKKDPNINPYNFIVEFLWKKGFSEFTKLNFKSGAYRYSK